MFRENHTLLMLASEDGPITKDQARSLLREADRLVQHAGAAGAASMRRQHIANAWRLVRRLDPADAAVAEIIAWLEDQARRDPQCAPVVEPEAPPAAELPAPLEELAAVEPAPTAEEIEHQRELLEHARRQDVEARAELEHNVAARAAAKTKALETRAREDWDAYHALDRLCVEGEEQATLASEDLAMVGRHVADLERAAAEARLDAAIDRASASALDAAIGPAVELDVKIAELTRQRDQIVWSAMATQNLAAAEALAIGKSLDIPEDATHRRLRLPTMSNDGVPCADPRMVFLRLAQLTQARVAAAVAAPAEAAS